MEIKEVIQNLPRMKYVSPAKKSAIKTAEEMLGISFAEEYRQYLRAFGCVSADEAELTGLARANRLNVVTVTRLEINKHDNYPDGMYVIMQEYPDEDSCILQDSDGIIYILGLTGEPVQIAESLAEFLLRFE